MSDEELLRKFLTRHEPVVAILPGSKSIAERIGDKPIVVIGTSGSDGYLRDETGSRRFWPVTVPQGAPPQEMPDDGQTCDGLHDEDAPTLYLCSRCFPYGEIPPDTEDDGYTEAARDDHEEME